MATKDKKSRKKETGTGSVAIAIDKDIGTQQVIPWTINNLASPGQTISLIHVLSKSHSSSEVTAQQKQQSEKLAKDLFIPIHFYCSVKEINCRDILLEDVDKVRAIIQTFAIEHLVVGATSRNSIMRLFKTDLPTVSKSAPDFCNVFVISKGKLTSVRNASRPPPYNNSMQFSEFDYQYPVTLKKVPKHHDYSNVAGSTSVEADPSRSPLVERQGMMKPHYCPRCLYKIGYIPF